MSGHKETFMNKKMDLAKRIIVALDVGSREGSRNF
jgi:hypothetical protein